MGSFKPVPLCLFGSLVLTTKRTCVCDFRTPPRFLPSLTFERKAKGKLLGSNCFDTWPSPRCGARTFCGPARIGVEGKKDTLGATVGAIDIVSRGTNLTHTHTITHIDIYTYIHIIYIYIYIYIYVSSRICCRSLPRLCGWMWSRLFSA